MRAFAAVAYAFLITMAGTTLPTPLYVLYRARFGFSELMVTVIFATYAAGVIVALLLFGRLSDDIGRRRALLPGLVLAGCSAVCFLLAHGVALLLVGRLLSGVSAGIFTGTATAALVDLAPDGAHGRATLVATMVNMGGLGLGPLLSGALVQWAPLDLRLTFWVNLALVAVALVALVALVPDPPDERRRLRFAPQTLLVPREVRAVFVRAALAGFAGFAVLGMFTAVSPAFVAGLLHERSHVLLGLVVCAAFTASTAGQLALARVPGPALVVGSAGLIGGALIIAASLAASSLVLLILGALVAGAAQGLSFRAGLSAVNAQAPEDQRAAVASSFFVVAYVAISIPVIGVGVLSQAVGLRAAGLVFTAVIALLAATVLVLVRAQSRVPA